MVYSHGAAPRTRDFEFPYLCSLLTYIRRAGGIRWLTILVIVATSSFRGSRVVWSVWVCSGIGAPGRTKFELFSQNARALERGSRSRIDRRYTQEQAQPRGGPGDTLTTSMSSGATITEDSGSRHGWHALTDPRLRQRPSLAKLAIVPNRSPYSIARPNRS